MKYSFRAGLVLAACALSAIRCGEYAHTNPYELGTPLELSIQGPDQLTAQQVPASYAVTVVPALPKLAPAWSSSDPRIVTVLGVQADGTVVVRALTPGTITLTVSLRDKRQSKRVVVQ